MTSSSRGRDRVQRLDADRMAEAVYAGTGIRLTVEGPCPGGQVGAAYVRWPDGHRSVLKWRAHTELAALRAGPLAVSETLRAGGFPAPATELAVQAGHAVVTVQELLPGTPVERLDRNGLDQALALNESLTGRLAHRTDIPALALHLREDGPGYCLHGPLRDHSPRTAALERRIAAIGAARPDRLDGTDAVHLDFHPGNMLAVDATITGIIDWDGAARGDRRFDLVTLRFGLLHAEQTEPDTVAHLDAVLDTVPPDVLLPSWAHMSLRMTDWAIRHFAAAEVDQWLDLAERRLP
ncbi:phosphotransferase [Streptomyces sp. NBC_00654]|uniref:phosphotransferase n=1 Tax=Streptomyces sp. NBC_00654 TaxID=2975799 RepID=UPI002254C739|nr:phosphotransferase [Streptomyces sp. NBC_00654]MCX4963490.1 phosphotransferase [Streptomyces sp. NBC_00654]